MDGKMMENFKTRHNKNVTGYHQHRSHQTSYLSVLLLSLFLLIPVIAAAAGTYPYPIPPRTFSDEIATEVGQEDAKIISDDEKSVEMAKRDMVQSIQNAGINSGLYLQNTENDFNANISSLHFTKFCDEAATGEGGNGYKCQSDPLYAHGDIKLSTLLTSPSLNEYERNAASVFIRNFIQPKPNTLFVGTKVTDLKTDKEGSGLQNEDIQKNITDLLLQQTVLSVAREPFAEMIAIRTPVTDAKTGQVTQPSFMSQMEKQASQRFLNTEWYKTLEKNKKSVTDYLDTKKGKEDYVVTSLLPMFDIVTMDAYRTWLETERYKQGERIEALLSGILVQLNKQSEATTGLVSKTQGVTITPPTLPEG